MILIINGDEQFALSTTPLLNVLHNQTNYKLSVLCSKNISNIFINNEFIESVYVTNDKLFNNIILVHKIRKNNFNVVMNINEEEIYLNSLFIILSGAKYKVGFEGTFNKLLTNSVALPNKITTHLIDRLLSLLNTIDIEYSKSKLNIFYNIPSKYSKIVDSYFIKHDLKYNFVSVINISGKKGLDFWGAHNYKRILKFLSNYDTKILVASSYTNLGEAEQVTNKKYQTFYYNDLDEFAALVRESNFIFTPDSFAVQLAAAFKIPVFCLFASKHEGEFINVPYNSDFDYVFTSKSELSQLSLGSVLNNFVPYYDYVYQRYNKKGNEG